MKSIQYTVESATSTIFVWRNMVDGYLDAPTACVLVETPQRVIFRMLREGLSAKEITESTSCIVFDSHCELRLEKTPWAEEGAYRLIHDQAGAAKTACVRESRYHLRCAPEGDTSARQLIYAEYFTEEESGMLVSSCARLAGVVQGGVA